MSISYHSTVTCPVCAYQAEETMPDNACVRFYFCPKCHTRLQPKGEDCCVFCSYGSIPCPPVQAVNGKCC